MDIFLNSLFIGSGIATIIIFFIKKRIEVEIENSIKNKFEIKIENLRSELTISQSVLQNSLITQSEGIKATFEKRLNSIDEFWSHIIAMETYVYPLQFDSYMSVSEIENLNKYLDGSKKFHNTVSSSFSQIKNENYTAFIIAKSPILERNRPYIGEDLWLLLFYFNLFIGRILYVYSSDYEAGKNLTHWTNQKYLTETLNDILTMDEQNFIYNSKFGTIDRCVNIFKQKILKKIAELTSGVLVGKSSIENAIALSEIMENVKRNSNK